MIKTNGLLEKLCLQVGREGFFLWKDNGLNVCLDGKFVETYDIIIILYLK